jgi:tetratricopeptide repeat protein/AMIN domain-containing protein
MTDSPRATITKFGTAFVLLTAMASLSVPSHGSDEETGLASLTKIRTANHEKYVRVVFDTSAPTPYTIIESEGTLILELENLETRTLEKPMKNMGQVQSVLISPIDGHTARISFENTKPVRPRVSSYTPDHYGGHRIVVDLWPAQDIKVEAAKPTAEKVVASEDIHLKKPLPMPAELRSSMPNVEEVNRHGPVANLPPQGILPTDQVVLPVDQGVLPKQEPSTIEPEPTRKQPTKKPKERPLVKPIVVKASVTKGPLLAALEKLKHGDPKGACDLIQSNFPRGTWNLEAMMTEGACLKDQAKFDEAANLFADVLSFDPSNLIARIGLAEAQVATHDLEAARDNYARALGDLESGKQSREISKRLQVLSTQLSHGLN